MSTRNPAYDRPVEPVASMSHQPPMEQRKADHPDEDEEVAMEVAPLLHAEMQKVHGRTRCQTCAIVTQTVLYVKLLLVNEKQSRSIETRSNSTTTSFPLFLLFSDFHTRGGR